MVRMSLLFLCGVAGSRGQVLVEPQMGVPPMALLGKDNFDSISEAQGDTMEGMAASLQANPLNFPILTDFWCAWDLTDRQRTPALLVDDMQIDYGPYVEPIVPQIQTLIEAFRRQGLPIFWSAWWRFGPDDGYFNSMDRFYGPIGTRTEGNALYMHNHTHGGDVLASVGPESEEERKRVMHKSYSLSMFDERPMHWLVPNGQGTLHDELQRLGVDTVVQVGAWTDDCIISTAFQAMSLQYDVVVVEDGVSTASKQHFNAIEVMRGAVGKVMLTAPVADYINQGLPVSPPLPRAKSAGSRASRFEAVRPRDAAAAVQTSSGDAVTMLEAKSTERSSSAGTAEWLPLVLLAVVGPASFASGWLLRGRTERDIRSASGMLLA